MLCSFPLTFTLSPAWSFASTRAETARARPRCALAETRTARPETKGPRDASIDDQTARRDFRSLDLVLPANPPFVMKRKENNRLESF